MVDVWAVARGWLIDNPRNHFEQDARYAIRDPGLIDPLLQAVLDRKFGGRMPDSERGALRVARQVMGPYRALKQKPAGHAAILGAVREVYGAPPIVVEADGTVVADHGIAPGPIEKMRAKWTILKAEAAAEGHWRPVDIAASLDRMARAYPDAPEWMARVKLPRGLHRDAWRVRWWRGRRKVGIYRSSDPNVACVADDVDDMAPFLGGQRTFRLEDLRRVSRKDVMLGRVPDVPLR